MNRYLLILAQNYFIFNSFYNIKKWKKKTKHNLTRHNELNLHGKPLSQSPQDYVYIKPQGDISQRTDPPLKEQYIILPYRYYF